MTQPRLRQLASLIPALLIAVVMVVCLAADVALLPALLQARRHAAQTSVLDRARS